MTTTNTIWGIQGDLAELFHPDQWVNVYNVVTTGFFCECQVKDLAEALEDREPADYHLEPTDAEGVVMALNEALRLGREYQARGTVGAQRLQQARVTPRWFI